MAGCQQPCGIRRIWPEGCTIEIRPLTWCLVGTCAPGGRPLSGVTGGPTRPALTSQRHGSTYSTGTTRSGRAGRFLIAVTEACVHEQAAGQDGRRDSGGPWSTPFTHPKATTGGGRRSSSDPRVRPGAAIGVGGPRRPMKSRDECHRDAMRETGVPPTAGSFGPIEEVALWSSLSSWAHRHANR